MHTDPKARREHRVRVNLNEYEADFLKAQAHLYGISLATLVRLIVKSHLDADKKIIKKAA